MSNCHKHLYNHILLCMIIRHWPKWQLLFLAIFPNTLSLSWAWSLCKCDRCANSLPFYTWVFLFYLLTPDPPPHHNGNIWQKQVTLAKDCNSLPTESGPFIHQCIETVYWYSSKNSVMFVWPSWTVLLHSQRSIHLLLHCRFFSLTFSHFPTVPQN